MTPSGSELAVVVPVYNEEKIIGEVLDDWVKELQRLEINFEIHVYNDGSKDNTLHILDQYYARNNNIVVHDKPNTGHGPTILLGYRENSDTEWIFQIDSDNEISTEFFEEFWRRRKGFDFLIGRRVERDGPLSRRFMTCAARMIVRFLYGKGVFDVNCPYRLMRAELFKGLFLKIPSHTFAPNVIVSGVACKNNYRVFEIPVVHSQRTTGEVSIQKAKLLKAALRALWQTMLFRFSE
jgi:dolichol-phosphate mannosyltransferase